MHSMTRRASSTLPPVNGTRLLGVPSYSRPDRSARVPASVSSAPPRLPRELSGLVSKSFLQTRNDSKNRAIPENGGRPILPALAPRVENHVIPVESLLYAAVWLGMRRLLLCGFSQRLGYQVFRIPKLVGAQIGNSRECASAGDANRWAGWAPKRQAPAGFCRDAEQAIPGLPRPPADSMVRSVTGAEPGAPHRFGRQMRSGTR